eukprot:scaffold65848_cov65-Attheya_sp.AAC.1
MVEELGQDGLESEWMSRIPIPSMSPHGLIHDLNLCPYTSGGGGHSFVLSICKHQWGHQWSLLCDWPPSLYQCGDGAAGHSSLILLAVIVESKLNFNKGASLAV